MVSKLVRAPDTLDKTTKNKDKFLEHRATDPISNAYQSTVSHIHLFHRSTNQR